MKNLFRSFYESPIGLLEIVADSTAITELNFGTQKTKSEENTLTQEAIRQLQEYFDKERVTFEIPTRPSGTAFQKKVWTELQRIEYGHTFSYQKLAKQVGGETYIRAVGRANGQNPIPIIIPCHRVIGKNGSLVGYAGGTKTKQHLLHLEGATFQPQLL